MVTAKKKNVSKKKKSSWRKHVDVTDVDTFLEEKRLEERLGGAFETRANSDLFIVDTIPSKTAKNKFNVDDLNKSAPQSLKQIKREKIRQSLSECFPMLRSHSKVKDPVIKRDRRHTKEERKHPLLKKKEEELLQRGVLKAKDAQAIKDSNVSKKKRLQKPQRGEYKNDIWSDDEIDVSKERFIVQEWLTNDTKRHNLHGLGKTNKLKPASITKKTSVIPSIEPPHPGMSYNPSFEDHQDLLRLVAEKEATIIKSEKHLNRVTKGMFSKVTPNKKHESWVEEMSEGLPIKGQTVDDESDTEFKSINPAVKNKKKTLQTRRKQKEERLLLQSRTIAKKEKRKVSDIYQLRRLKRQIEHKFKQENITQEKREKNRRDKQKGTKQLSCRKFEDADLDFQMSNEITGNLRNAKQQGDILRDRFVSMRKRNILEVTEKTLKKKAKVKKFVRPGHKEDWKTTVAR